MVWLGKAECREFRCVLWKGKADLQRTVLAPPAMGRHLYVVLGTSTQVVDVPAAWGSEDLPTRDATVDVCRVGRAGHAGGDALCAALYARGRGG